MALLSSVAIIYSVVIKEWVGLSPIAGCHIVCCQWQSLVVTSLAVISPVRGWVGLSLRWLSYHRLSEVELGCHFAGCPWYLPWQWEVELGCHFAGFRISACQRLTWVGTLLAVFGTCIERFSSVVTSLVVFGHVMRGWVGLSLRWLSLDMSWEVELGCHFAGYPWACHERLGWVVTSLAVFRHVMRGCVGLSLRWLTLVHVMRGWVGLSLRWLS